MRPLVELLSEESVVARRKAAAAISELANGSTANQVKFT